MRERTLVALAHAPLLGADDLALLHGLGERGARRALEARVSAGEAGTIADPATRRHLYVLTAAGVVAGSALMGTTPEELEGRYGLGERALLRRLPALRRLVASRCVLLRLAVALVQTGGALEDWRPYPVRWAFHRAGRREILLLDGAAILRFADGWRCPIGYLWDGAADLPPEALTARLDRLAELQADPAYALPAGPRVPPVLLVTAAPERLPAGDRPALLWTTAESLESSDPLLAPWWMRGTPGANRDACTLRAALDRPGRRPPRPTPAPSAAPARNPSAPRSPDGLRRHADRLRTEPGTALAVRDLLALPLVVPPRAWPLLRCVGRHPLLTRTDLAIVFGCNPFDVWDLLQQICRYGLCQAWQPRQGGRAWRYSLTTRGTQFLAQEAALPATTYRRIAGLLDDAQRPGERGLSFARANLEHTDCIHRTFLAFLSATRARGGTLEWRGEWACTRTYCVVDRYGRERLQTLRPDAELRYEGAGGPLHAFLEIDRGTTAAWRLANKIDQYNAYRVGGGEDAFTVLLVTIGHGRADAPLARALALGQLQRTAPLDLRATTLTDLTAHGPWAPIWRDPRGVTVGLLSLMPR